MLYLAFRRAYVFAVDQELLNLFVVVEEVADELGGTLPQLFIFVRDALEEHLQVVVIEALENRELHDSIANDVAEWHAVYSVSLRMKSMRCCRLPFSLVGSVDWCLMVPVGCLGSLKAAVDRINNYYSRAAGKCTTPSSRTRESESSWKRDTGISHRGTGRSATAVS